MQRYKIFLNCARKMAIIFQKTWTIQFPSFPLSHFWHLHFKLFSKQIIYYYIYYNIYNNKKIIWLFYSISHSPTFSFPNHNFRNSENHHAGMFGRVVTKVNEVKCQKWESGKVGKWASAKPKCFHGKKNRIFFGDSLENPYICTIQ